MEDSHIPSLPSPELRLHHLRVLKLLGKGATGTVFLVHDGSGDDQPFALKLVEKSSSVHRHSDRRARHEVSVLRRLSAHPFLPRLIGSSEDHEFICWGIPYCPGGDLNVLRYRQNDHVFSAAVIRFYLAEIVCALENLHSQGVVYRDLKPENILVQQSGHVTLTDFDLSRDLPPKRSDYQDSLPAAKRQPSDGKPSRFFYGLKKAKSARVSPVTRRNPSGDDSPSNNRSNSFVGTEEYVAPEVIRGDGHEFAVDWWAVGVLSYEMLYGSTPFKGKTRKDTFRRILLAEPEFMGKPNALTDLIGRLLEKDPTRRLGYRRGAAEIKEHEFFKGLQWELLTEVLRPPFLPSKEETEVTENGVGIKEYLRQMKLPPTPLWSPSMDECRNNVSLTEF